MSKASPSKSGFNAQLAVAVSAAGSALEDKPYVGGQAVIEGVMMRSPRCLAIAVRRKDGRIVIREDAWIALWDKLKFLRWPLLRGSVILVESMYNGLQALNFAAKQAELDDPETESSSESVEGIHKKSDIFAFGLSFVLAFALFVGAPHLLAVIAGEVMGVGSGVKTFWFHALDGFFKIGIFVGYIWGISRIPEIRRVFEYHGAEHKAVNAYEGDLPLTLEATKPLTTFHARCGTSFMLFVLMLSIFLFAGVLPMLPAVSENNIINHLSLIFFKLPLMFPLAGIAYEINRYAAKHPDQLWVQAIVVPGKWMQKLTTKEPKDDAQLEVALSAMRLALQREHETRALAYDEMQARAAAKTDADRVLVFKNYGEVAQAIQPAY